MHRLFISYRSADGKKDANRLCDDLCRLYGNDAVFFDKQDLQAGASWRSAIHAALGSRPVVLLLISPGLLLELHPDGGRRVDREDDPVRQELLLARQGGATILPLLIDNTEIPASPQWPPSLRFLTETHALRLRTEDWAHDLHRLVGQLTEQGLAPAPWMARSPIPVRWWLLGLGGLLLSSVLAWSLSRTLAPPPRAPGPSAAAPAATPIAESPDLSGMWWMLPPGAPAVRVDVAPQGSGIFLSTALFATDHHPGWRAYAQRLQNQGLALSQVRYVGTGSQQGPELTLSYEAFGGRGEGPLDTGRITLQADSHASTLTSQLWSNGDQATEAWRLQRKP